MTSSVLFRTRVLSVFIIVGALVLTVKLYQVQIVQGDEFSERADRQYARPSGGLFNRGTIFLTNKDGSLMTAAGLQTGFTLVANPSTVTDPHGLFEKLRQVVPLDRDLFLSKVGKSSDPHEEIASRLDAATADRIETLDLPQVSLYKDRWRFYPAEYLASNTIGFVGYRENSLEGRYGLERYYEDVLRRDGETLYTNFFVDLFSNVKHAVNRGPLEGDIVTSIEPTVEAFLEEKLKDIQERWDSRETGGIILNPKTGELYAMAAYPTFDPNYFSKESDPSVFRNPLVESVYEMGSIVKSLTLAAGIDAGVVTPESVYQDDGYLMLNTQRIENFDGKGRGRVSMQEVLSQSLNTGAVHVALKLGHERFREYMLKRFELGEETGIDLPNESPGLVSNLESSQDIEMATASFGQGIAITPIALVRALASLGNGGRLIQPHVVSRVNYKIGLSTTVSNDEPKPVLTVHTSEEITRMLVRVVDTALLGGTVKLPHVSVAAKTGTAQMVRPDGNGYDEGRYLHSFFGYFPAFDPRFLIFLYTVEPQGVEFASHTLTMPFHEITKFLIHYYEIPPDR